jgi:hypothetical protein
MTLGFLFRCSQTKCPSFLPFGPRTVHSLGRYAPPFAAYHHIRMRLCSGTELDYRAIYGVLLKISTEYKQVLFCDDYFVVPLNMVRHEVGYFYFITEE